MDGKELEALATYLRESFDVQAAGGPYYLVDGNGDPVMNPYRLNGKDYSFWDHLYNQPYICGAIDAAQSFHKTYSRIRGSRRDFAVISLSTGEEVYNTKDSD